jgi:hypothetical protein
MKKSTMIQMQEMQLHQLERLLETKRMKFSDAYYVICSDAPTVQSVQNLLDVCDASNDFWGISVRLRKEICKIK